MAAIGDLVKTIRHSLKNEVFEMEVHSAVADGGRDQPADEKSSEMNASIACAVEIQIVTTSDEKGGTSLLSALQASPI